MYTCDEKEIVFKKAPEHSAKPKPKFQNLDGPDEVQIKKSNLELRQNLANARTAKGLSRKDLAAKLSIKETILAGWENGSELIPKAVVCKLERILDARLRPEVKAATVKKVDNVKISRI